MSLFYLRKRLYEIVWNSDMITTRVSLAIGSLVWGILLLWPTVLFTPSRTTYRLMADIADENVWGVVFVVHGVLSLYQLISRELKEDAVLANNLIGCILWTSSTVACFASHFQSWDTYSPPAAMSADVSFVLASFWLLTKTLIARSFHVR